MSNRAKRQADRKHQCDCCNKPSLFCWQCRGCGFALCQECMYENAWGLSCNGITWVCPDCGQQNGLGNQ